MNEVICCVEYDVVRPDGWSAEEATITVVDGSWRDGDGDVHFEL